MLLLLLLFLLVLNNLCSIQFSHKIALKHSYKTRKTRWTFLFLFLLLFHKLSTHAHTHGPATRTLCDCKTIYGNVCGERLVFFLFGFYCECGVAVDLQFIQLKFSGNASFIKCVMCYVIFTVRIQPFACLFGRWIVYSLSAYEQFIQCGTRWHTIKWNKQTNRKKIAVDMILSGCFIRYSMCLIFINEFPRQMTCYWCCCCCCLCYCCCCTTYHLI